MNSRFRQAPTELSACRTRSSGSRMLLRSLAWLSPASTGIGRMSRSIKMGPTEMIPPGALHLPRHTRIRMALSEGNKGFPFAGKELLRRIGAFNFAAGQRAQEQRDGNDDSAPRRNIESDFH